MKITYKLLLVLCCLFLSTNIFCDEVCNEDTDCRVETFSNEEKINFSLAWGHLTAFMFKDINPIAAYFSAQEYIQGMNAYKANEPCKISKEQCEKEMLEILTLLQSQIPLENEKNKERSWTLGWHSAEQIKEEFAEFLLLDECLQGILDELEGIESPQSMQKTIELLQKHITPIATKKLLEKNTCDINEMIKSDSLVILNFYNASSEPCMRVKFALEEIQEEGKALYFLNSLQYSGYMAEEKITALPTIWIFKDGKKVHEFTGFRSKDEILEILKEFE